MRRSSVFVALAVLGQFSCGGSQPTSPTSTANTQSGQALITGTTALDEGHQSSQLSLMEGTKDITNLATWRSADSTVATVSSGLVRAMSVGTTQISAVYLSQNATTSVTVTADEDCIPYDTANLGMIQNTNDTPPSWTITAPYLVGFQFLASADTQPEATNLLALFQRYSQQCFVGRGNNRPNRLQYVFPYFRGANGRQTTITPEDCVTYSSNAVQIVSQAGAWAVVSAGTQLALLDTPFDASVISGIASQASSECFIGRGNTRKDPYGYITEYWK